MYKMYVATQQSGRILSTRVTTAAGVLRPSETGTEVVNPSRGSFISGLLKKHHHYSYGEAPLNIHAESESDRPLDNKTNRKLQHRSLVLSIALRMRMDLINTPAKGFTFHRRNTTYYYKTCRLHQTRVNSRGGTFQRLSKNHLITVLIRKTRSSVLVCTGMVRLVQASI